MNLRKTLSFFYHLIKGAIQYPLRDRWHVVCDYLKLYRHKGLDFDEYYNFAFEERSEAFKEDFLALNEQRFYLDLLNPQKYYILARNKYFAHKIMENGGIRKPELYAYYHPGCRCKGNEMAGNAEELCGILQEKKVSKCVVKTTESSHGDNVTVITSIEYKDREALLHLYNGTICKLSCFIGKEPLLFESLVEQTEQMNALNATSVNTVRFMTALYPDGEARLIATFIKIGRAGKCVDNAGAGGNVDACVDTETGTLQYAIQYDGWRNIRNIDSHPDSKSPINGITIENWDTIKKEVLRFHQAFPYIKAAGWDIAITEQGPVAIEVNDMWDRTGQYFIRRGWRPEIRDCYLAWKKEGCTCDFGRNRSRLPQWHLNKIVAHPDFNKNIVTHS